MKITTRQLRKLIQERIQGEISVEEDMFRAGEDDAFDGKEPRLLDDPDYMDGFMQATDEIESQNIM